MSGIAEEEAAIDNTLPTTNTGRIGIAAMARKQQAPAAASLEAALAAGHPKLWTTETTNGVRSSPMLPPPATNALAVAPALNHLTAMSSRKVVPAVSSVPLATARQRS